MPNNIISIMASAVNAIRLQNLELKSVFFANPIDTCIFLEYSSLLKPLLFS